MKKKGGDLIFQVGGGNIEESVYLSIYLPSLFRILLYSVSFKDGYINASFSSFPHNSNSVKQAELNRVIGLKKKRS